MTELTAKRKALFTLRVVLSGRVHSADCRGSLRPADIAYGYVTPETLRAMTPDYQPAVFARHVIGASAKAVIVNGEEQFRINSHGYRGRDFTVEKPEGVTPNRVLWRLVGVRR